MIIKDNRNYECKILAPLIDESSSRFIGSTLEGVRMRCFHVEEFRVVPVVAVAFVVVGVCVTWLATWPLGGTCRGRTVHHVEAFLMLLLQPHLGMREEAQIVQRRCARKYPEEDTTENDVPVLQRT